MTAVITRDAKEGWRIVSHKAKGRRIAKHAAQRANRRIEKVRLSILHDDYAPTGRPRLTGWDIA